MPDPTSPQSGGDSPKKRKRREELIVAGTLALVLLTIFLLVKRNSSNAQSPPLPTPDSTGGNPYGGSSAGGSPAPDNSSQFAQLSAQIGNLPAQLAALLGQQQSPDTTGTLDPSGIDTSGLGQSVLSFISSNLVSPTGVTGRKSSTASKASSSPNYGLHTVVKGDTLAAIARKYGLTIAQLRAANPQFNFGAPLMAGEILRVRSSAAIPIEPKKYRLPAPVAVSTHVPVQLRLPTVPGTRPITQPVILPVHRPATHY